MMELISKCQAVNTLSYKYSRNKLLIAAEIKLLVSMAAYYHGWPSSYFADFQNNSYLIHSDLFFGLDVSEALCKL